MHGNVWELCGDGARRNLRGGACESWPPALRSGYCFRGYWFIPESIGFRVVRDL
jgi:formylglycine-generating enzyme required for sulfatase activity